MKRRTIITHRIARWVHISSVLVSLVMAASQKSVTTNSTSAQHIIGGTDAPEDRYPYIASLYDRNNALLCGGSLIAPDLVLTAAHCAYDFDRIEIARHNTQNDQDVFETFRVRHFAVHPSYVYSEEFDFLIVQMDGISSFPPVKLNRDENVPFQGQELVVMGFGDTSLNGRSFPSVLQEATVFSISNEECNSRQDSSYSYAGKITEDSLCAQAAGRDACVGDSGAPLVIAGVSASADVQVGNVLWGRGCASETFPGVYGRVSFVFDWIAETVCSRSVNPPADFACSETVQEPAPDQTAPTVAPSTQLPITVILQLDRYPNETWWVIDDSLHNTVGGSLVGFYEEQGEARSVVWLSAGEVYSFYIHDVYGDGMCCSYGQGEYAVYLGDLSSSTAPLREEDLLLSGAGNFGSEAQHVFQMPRQFSVELPDTATPLTVVLELDRYPEEIGWSLTRLGVSEETIAFRDHGTFYEKNRNKQVTETVWIDEGSLYNFTIFDRYGDGMCCKYGSGAYRVFLGTRDTNDQSSIVFDKTGSFLFSETDFVLAETRLPPSSSFVTLELEFDGRPDEVSWILEMEVPSTEVATGRQASDDATYFTIAFGTAYDASLAYAVVSEQHLLPLIPDSPARRFFFTLIDSAGNGLCCDIGTGAYRLFYGPPGDNTVLAVGDAAGKSRESKDFLLSGTKPPASSTSERVIARGWLGMAIVSIVMLYCL